MASLLLQGISKHFGDTAVIHGANLEIANGEFVVFVGPSGCGKSTLLRLIAGLEEASGGDIYIGGQRVNDVPPGDRGTAMVFQSYALYPHMTVRDNISFGLRMTSKIPKDEIARRVETAATALHLTPLLERKPRALSGGQRQRTAIGRAIVREPAVFLLDEPLSNLDAELRAQMRIELRQLHRRLSATMIYVTHDQVEAMTLADRIVVLNGGRIEQIGAPMDIYRSPRNLFVAGFIGSPKMNFLSAQARKADGKIALCLSSAGNAEMILSPQQWRIEDGERVTVGVRPDMLYAADSAPAEGEACFSLIVDASEHLGGETFYHCLTPSGETVLVEARGWGDFKELPLRLRPEDAHVFGEDGDSRAI